MNTASSAAPRPRGGGPDVAAGALLKIISLAELFGIAGLALTMIAPCRLASPQMRSTPRDAAGGGEGWT